jgi:hypothetical protein
MKVGNLKFRIVGISVDPINNGYVAYLPINGLMNCMWAAKPNLLIVTLDETVNRSVAIGEKNTVNTVDANLEVCVFSQTVSANKAFLGATWQISY